MVARAPCVARGDGGFAGAHVPASLPELSGHRVARGARCVSSGGGGSGGAHVPGTVADVGRPHEPGRGGRRWSTRSRCCFPSRAGPRAILSGGWFCRRLAPARRASQRAPAARTLGVVRLQQRNGDALSCARAASSVAAAASRLAVGAALEHTFLAVAPPKPSRLASAPRVLRGAGGPVGAHVPARPPSARQGARLRAAAARRSPPPAARRRPRPAPDAR